MPLGVMINCLAVAAGGILGNVIGGRLNDDLKEKMNMVFGVSAMTMGICSIILLENLPAVIFSVTAGTALGLAMKLGDRINRLGKGMSRVIEKYIPRTSGTLTEQEYNSTLLTIIVLFCASGTGIYGSLVEGMSGDHSIMISKSILDLPTALIFACTLGVVVSFVAVPQLLIFSVLFFLGGVLIPYTTPAMVNDFKAVGGIVLVATGFRILRLKNFPTADMIPAMVIAMPVSWFWSNVIVPMLSAM